MLHAAALADPATGATAALVAASGTGKTTATRALGVDLAYLTDETAGVTDDGSLVRYRKPLSLLEGGAVKTQRAASALGLTLTEAECHLAAVLVIERDPDHGQKPVVTRLDTVDAIASVAPQCSYLASMDTPLHRLAALLHRVGGAHHVRYQESHTLGPILRQLLRCRS